MENNKALKDLIKSQEECRKQKDDNKCHHLFYGASNGLNFEPYCVKLAHYPLHDEYSINTMKMLLQLKNM